MLLPFETRPLKGQICTFYFPPVKIGADGRNFQSIFKRIIYALNGCFRFPIRYSVLNPERFKGNWGQILRPNLYFLTPVNITGRESKISE